MHPLQANRKILVSCLADLLSLVRQFANDPELQEPYILEATRVTTRLKHLQFEIERLDLD